MINKTINNQKIEKMLYRVFIALIGITFFLSLNYYQSTFGGGIGLNVVPNATIWLSISSIIVLSIVKILLTNNILISSLIKPLFLVVVLIIFLGLVKTDADIQEVILRASQLFGFFLLVFSITQFRLTERKINQVLSIILLAALVEIFYGLGQLHYDPRYIPSFLNMYLDGGRPPMAGFLQINAFSIFLVTVIVLSIFFIAQPLFKEKFVSIKILPILVILGGAYLIAVISSRAALLALIISVPFIIYTSWFDLKKNKKWMVWALSCLTIGLLIGFSIGKGVSKIENKTTSARLLAWSLSIDAIKKEPLFGHGLGRFTKAFYDQVESRQSNNEKLDNEVAFFSHPHNEMLYWGVESGVVSIIAIIMFVLFYLRLIFASYVFRRALQYLTLLFPLVLSTQVSLPFYLSALLLVLFVFLLVLPFTDKAINRSFSLHKGLKLVSMTIVGFCFLTYVWFIQEVLHGQQTLTQYVIEKPQNYKLLQGEFDNPYWHKVAKNYAHQRMMIVQYKRGEVAEARKHLYWFEHSSLTEEEPMYYEVMLRGYSLFGEKENYARIKKKADLRYPHRFDAFLEELK